MAVTIFITEVPNSGWLDVLLGEAWSWSVNRDGSMYRAASGTASTEKRARKKAERSARQLNRARQSYSYTYPEEKSDGS